MTNPSDPGPPPHRPAPGPPGGPYGPPPPPHQPPGQVPGPRPPSHTGTGPFPVQPPPQPRTQPPPQGPQSHPPTWARSEPTEKGLIGALFDANFNYLVTPKLIKLWYLVALLLISLQCLGFFSFGVWVATWDDWWAWGVMLVVSTPLVWLFELLLVRILMEAVVVRFKGVEHLRVIKDKI
ncbi:DUF4282 domain-containing protein [Actinomadura roseirufa]|uniref:DUF4282 domain-containing protein n=1 Tax=Actinomadura roseirufa TaxID=2094049 RepID=UPI001A955181|nr:DUF4282 domain-containing protein [Actinomadura roseirufa]